MEKRWQPGETVVVRWAPYERMTKTYAASSSDPLNVGGWPHVVLEDSDVRTVLYLPEGTELWRWNIDEQAFRPPRLAIGDSLMLLFEGKPYFVSVYYGTESAPAPWVRYYFPDGKGDSTAGRSTWHRPSGARVPDSTSSMRCSTSS
jgi:hypothetical protein